MTGVAGVLGVFLAWRFVDTRAHDAAPHVAPDARPATASTRPAAPAPSPAVPPDAPVFPSPGAPPAPPADLPPEARAAIDRFAVESLPRIDACVGAIRLERALVPTQATFARQGDAYVLQGVQPLPGAPEVPVSVRRCLDVLVGRPVAIDPADAGDAEAFSHHVAWLLPVSS